MRAGWLLCFEPLRFHSELERGCRTRERMQDREEHWHLLFLRVLDVVFIFCPPLDYKQNCQQETSQIGGVKLPNFGSLGLVWVFWLVISELCYQVSLHSFAGSAKAKSCWKACFLLLISWQRSASQWSPVAEFQIGWQMRERGRQTDSHSHPSTPSFDIWIIWEKQSQPFFLLSEYSLWRPFSWAHQSLKTKVNTPAWRQSFHKYTSVKLKPSVNHCAFFLLFVLMNRCCLNILEPEKLEVLCYHSVLPKHR